MAFDDAKMSRNVRNVKRRTQDLHGDLAKTIVVVTCSKKVHFAVVPAARLAEPEAHLSVLW